MSEDNFELSIELKMLRDSVRKFMREQVLPLESKLDFDAADLPQEDFDRLSKMTRDMGLWCFGEPKEYGGGGLSTFASVIITEEISQCRAGLYFPAYNVFGYDASPPPVIYEGTKEQIEKYAIPCIRDAQRTFFAITEPSGGSNPGETIQLRAVKDGDDWILNGTKTFASRFAQAAWGVTFARTDPTDKRGGISCFIIDKEMKGISYRKLPVICTSRDPYEVSFENCRVPQENLLGEIGKGLELSSQLLARNRILYSIGNVGVAQAALRMAIEYSKQRVVFGEPLANKEAIQWMLADSDVEIRAARWLVWETAWKADRGEDFRHEVSIAKLYSSEILGNVIDRVVQIHGGYGVSRELPLERWYREARVRRIGEGPSEVMRYIISRNLIKGYKRY